MKSFSDMYEESRNGKSEHKNKLVNKINEMDLAENEAKIKAMNDEIERIIPDLEEKPIKHYLWELIKIQWISLNTNIKKNLKTLSKNKGQNHE